MELGVLGPLQVRRHGTPVAIPGAKPRAVLTMLGLHGGALVSADALMELLWGEEPPRTAAKALQTHISSLRRILGDGVVLTQGAGWILADADVDAARYKVAARRGRDAAAAGDNGRAVACFDAALGLWRGIPELPDGRRGTSEKTRWIEGHAALVEDRADALLATGRAAEIIGELEAAVAEAPLRERRWGQLMLALYRAGRQGEALGAYQRARAQLADELGVDPGPELRRLESTIVAQDASLDVLVVQNLSSVTRAVTFLLTDIEGSTAAWEADAAAMAVALARHDELVEQVVTSRGGRLIKTRGEGDATFSVFDRPSAGAAAAVELQDAIGHEPWALREPMRIRVALHTGEAELRDGDYFGRAVNRAARLRALAAGGQILCSGATAELVIDTLPDDVVLTDLGMRQLRNLPRPEHVFELRLETGAQAAPPAQPSPAPMERPGLPAVLLGPGPFVGRGRELDGLLSAWQSTLAGDMQAVLIAGEPGVGKTRLAGEWSRRAYEQGAVVLYGRCDEDLGAPYQPFAEALRMLVPCLGPDRLRGLRGVEALLPLVPGLTDVLPDLPTPTRADPDTERYALFDAVVALLAAVSAGAPVVLVLDDLHWAAKPTLLLLRHLLRFGEHARVQVVGTYRSTDLDRSHPLAAMLADLHRSAGFEPSNRLQLNGLDEQDVAAYVAEAGYDDDELARALASVTGGNPFFLIQALHHVDESGGRWDQSTLPQGVREAVSRRLSRLSPETNKALATAAVIGSRFALELVESVVGEDQVDAFDEACQAGIVIEEPGGRYRFNHAIVRQSLLAELSSVRRMRLHQRIATTLENQPGAEDELLAELAHHYFECAWAGNAAKAVQYCRRAADQAMTRLGYEGAADLYDRALHALEEIDDELPDRDDQVTELLIARCEALLAAGDVGSAVGDVSQLQSATVDSARLSAWATCFDGQLSILSHPERLDEVEAAVGAAAARLAELDDAAGEATAHTVRAGCLARLGRIGDCEIALDNALTAARRAREHRRVNAVLANAPLAALWGPNPVPRAGGRCLDVVRLLRITTDSPAVEATSTRCQAVLEAFRGRAAAARRMIDSARRTVTELGLRHALLEVEQFAGIVELVADDAAAAEPHLRKAYNGFRRMGLDADTAETAALLGRACLVLDREAEADELCTESERLAGHALKASIAWRTLRALLLSRRGDYDEARRMAEEAVSVAGHTDLLVDHGDACLTLATVLNAAGETAGARAAAGRAVDLYERKGAAALAERARRLLGEHTVPSAPTPPRNPSVELDTAATRVGERVMAAVHRKDWDEFDRLFAPNVSIENRRKIVGVGFPSDAMRREVRRELEAGVTRIDHVMVAARGERVALSRMITSAVDESPGAPHDELLQVYAVDENSQVVRQVWFDVEDMDAAMAELDATYARFEKRCPRPPLENGVTRAYERLHAYFKARDWDAITDLLTDDYCGDDRRSVVGAGIRRGPDAAIEDYRSAADIDVTDAGSDTVATRGARLALARAHYARNGKESEAFRVDFLQLVEIDSDGRIAAMAAFDLDDFDAAIASLDTRYLAGEASAHARTWSVIAEGYAAFNRHEPPPTTPDCVSIDHRRGTAFAPGELFSYMRAAWDDTPDLTSYIDAVHRLNDMGALVTHVARGTSPEGVDAEWRYHHLLMVDGESITRSELFDESALDAALARFDQLTRPAPRLRNAASQADQRFWKHFPVRDWDAMAATLADDFLLDDRRQALNAGNRRGRDTEIANLKVMADLVGQGNVTSNVIAIRGERLALRRLRFSEQDRNPEAFYTEMIGIVEINADNRLAAHIAFDPDDINGAIAELDARYLAGEAAPYARTWSTIAGALAAHNRREVAAATPDAITLDHRRAVAFGPGEGSDFLRAGWELDQHLDLYVETVHRLTDVGAVFTWAGYGSSHDGFDAEWRAVDLMTVDGEMISRVEVFDESDLDEALARFDELTRPEPRLENGASRVVQQFLAKFAAREWDAMTEMLSHDISTVDRRRVVNAGIRQDRDAEINDFRSAADLDVTNATSDVIAIRGERLALIRSQVSRGDVDTEAFHVDLLWLLEIGSNQKIAGWATFDPDDFDAAVAELDHRYLNGEAAGHAHTWGLVTAAFAAINRHELPGLTPDWVNIDHRRGATFAAGDMTSYIHDVFDDAPDFHVDVAAVHRLSDLGAVVTMASHGTSTRGFQAEWREIGLLTFDGELLSRCELFDEADLPDALARFEELHRPAPRLHNTASEVSDRFLAYFAARDWDAMANMTADDFASDDRRRVVGAGIQSGRDVDMNNMRAWAEVGITKIASDVIAIRGQRLFLGRTRFFGREQGPGAFHSEVLGLVELDAEDRMLARVVFDPNDIDAAFEELDARYLAGEAAAYARTWSLLRASDAALDRYEVPAHTPDWANVDHRRATAFEPGGLIAYLRAGWDLADDVKNHILAVHRMTERGAVVTHLAHGRLRNRSDVEWREVALVMFEGDLVSRCELFDEADLPDALARFEELHRPAPRPENVTSRLIERFLAHFAIRDWDAMAELLADDFYSEDRRRTLNAGIRRGRDAEMANWHATGDVWMSDVSSTVIATRGAHLALFRFAFVSQEHEPEAFQAAALGVVQANDDNQATASIVFDPNDFDAAFEELDARYLAGEAAAHARIWSVITRAYSRTNRCELPDMTTDSVLIDHRTTVTTEREPLPGYLPSLWEIMPDLSVYIEAVHRLSDRGAVITQVARGTSQQGFDAEWRAIVVGILDGDLYTRIEAFDDTDLDAALTRFDELSAEVRPK
ncbi:AAA family ATPase [Mycobacterium avium subsp. hominissuis]|uniref:BTAD domain-containing putative transcriptional regulator n=1 Tax=Mycobacterium avium TaxID=1764 RepID=UPI001CC6E883|nr:BTAD domain-containing putative transcriptional regulator [Mycobacterium avium]MBZ4557629.1 AAA family ATPase [Mycobacterium avium subsp. hominissuis]MBZ4567369.1 AAA family ATPase [Mycobacterium avium subsp. hominissuis]MBZ4586205.1 AAA family ATPase [Mycobacterium avium subsp. hominissuis]MBZ4624558.1 AAA family ATPase [Mycobacterium avium subsp. hominissuis]